MSTDPGRGSDRVRLAELVAALSLGVDLGFGQPMEHVLRQCMIALRLAECVGLGEQERSVVYYAALLVNVGCHSDAHEQAKWFGDDITLKSGKYAYELGSVSGALAMMRHLGSGNPPLHRFRMGVEFAVSGHRDLNGMIAQHSAMARGLAEQIGLSAEVQEAVGASYEQWDGKGWPGELRGDAIPAASRLSQIGEFTEVAHRLGGAGAAVALAERRSGSQFDPSLAAAFCEHAEPILDGLDNGETWDAVIGAEPALALYLSDDEFDQALVAIADFVDLKSPYTMGHARGVSELADAAGTKLRLEPSDVTTLRRAALVSGLGRLGVSNAIWDKRGPLGAGERERVRLHPYLTERMLHQSSALAPLGAIVVQLRERIDGSGYPKGLSGAAISLSARIVGAADAYQADVRTPPASWGSHRRPRSPGAADRGESGPHGRRCGRGGAGRAGIASPADVRGRLASLLVRWTSCGWWLGASPARRSRPSGDFSEDGPQPYRAHLFQDRRVESGRGRSVRHAARPPPRRGVDCAVDHKDGAIAP